MADEGSKASMVVEWWDIGHSVKFTQHTNGCSMDWQLFEMIDWVNGEPAMYWPAGSYSSHPGTSDIEKAKVMAEGYIKWDGCAEFEVGGHHVCGRQGMRRVSIALDRIYDVAKQHIERWDGD